ncbi:MAG: hypothetical protein ACYCUM_13870 [Solirubrobacteraceae bacterium]
MSRHAPHTRAGRRAAGAALSLGLCALSLAGCSNPYASATSGQRPRIQSAGEAKAPPPAGAESQQPARVQKTPRRAIVQFASRYSNWTYKTLTRDQQQLAAIAVGAARLTEQRAAAASRGDATLARGKIENHGEVLAISRDLRRRGWWLIVTSEQTSGTGQYEALPTSDHVSLARLARLHGGYAVEEWLPQS